MSETDKNIESNGSPFRGRGGLIPGEYILKNEPIQCNVGRDTVTVTVTNTGDRPVQVGSHYHFFEANKQLEMDREQAFGMRLDIPAGTAVRFEPGEEKEVQLVTFGGKRHIYGFNNLVNGDTKSEDVKVEAMINIAKHNFKNKIA